LRVPFSVPRCALPSSCHSHGKMATCCDIYSHLHCAFSLGYTAGTASPFLSQNSTTWNSTAETISLQNTVLLPFKQHFLLEGRTLLSGSLSTSISTLPFILPPAFCWQCPLPCQLMVTCCHSSILFPSLPRMHLSSRCLPWCWPLTPSPSVAYCSSVDIEGEREGFCTFTVTPAAANSGK